MKRIIIISCILLAGFGVAGYSWQGSKSQQQYKGMELEINDLAQYGVIAYGPNDPDFRARLTALTAIPDSLSAEMLKYSVVLENKTPQKISAISIFWRFYPSEGDPIDRVSSFSMMGTPVFNDLTESIVEPQSFYPVSLLPDGSGIGKERLRQHEWKDDANARRRLETVSGLIARSVRWSFHIDSVMFSNGQMIGPDEYRYLAVLTAKINGARDLIKEIGMKLNRNEDAWAHAESYAARTDKEIEADFPDRRQRYRSPEYAYAFAKANAARALAWRKKNKGEQSARDLVQKWAERQIGLIRQ